MAATAAALENAAADFALIGHFDHWDRAVALLNAFPSHKPIARDEIATLLPWIPPRSLFHVTAHSTRGHAVRGVYIDCFIPPDELDASFARRNLQRVRAAAAAASREGARIATLGGFSSILLEGRTTFIEGSRTAFTTGNTLTAAYIVKSIEAALARSGRGIEKQRVLVIGSTGDIGSACVDYFAPVAKELLLVARQAPRLRDQLRSLAFARASTDIGDLLPDADVVICVASMPQASADLTKARPHAVICDAGYPPNVLRVPRECEIAFRGGMGEILGGYDVEPPAADVWGKNRKHAVGHGCLLEAILLALEQRFEAFSSGRGHITPDRIDEIYGIAERHGFVVAPLSETEMQRC